jgi:hypothetical protein
MIRTVMSAPVMEKKTARYTGIMKDETGAVIPAAALSALTLTIYCDNAAQTVILAPTNILNADRGTLDGSGNLAITLREDPSPDNALVDSALDAERHVLFIEWTKTNGRKGGHEVVYTVRNMAKVS